MNPDFQEIRKLIEGRFRRRLLFGLHVTLFVCVLAVTAWWMMTHQVYQGDLKNLWFLVGWAAILLVHWLMYTLANTRDREIEATWERLYGQAMPDDVPAQKLNPANRLLSDEADEIQDAWVEEKPKRTLHEE